MAKPRVADIEGARMTSQTAPTALAEFRDASFAYPKSPGGFRLSGLTFDVVPGEILGVIGPNSAGKTTLIRLLTRVVSPASGVIRLAGRPLADMSRREVARLVAVVPQDLAPAFPFTVEEMVLMGRYPHAPGRYFEDETDRARAGAAMARTGVLDLAAVPVARLAGGERQRVVLARALAQEPRLLVLDEPTAHLDLKHQAELVALLRGLNRASGLTVLIVTHDLNLASEIAGRMLLLHAGRVERAGTPEAVLDEATLSRVYGCAVVVDKHPITRRPSVHLAWPEGER
jgi:iron complex transport system ATP-binding protein